MRNSHAADCCGRRGYELTMIKHHLVISMSSFFFGLFGVSWDGVDEKIDDEFPAVQFIEIDELEALYAEGIEPHIIDVRAPNEFAVSHLQTALNLETATEIANAVPDKNTEIVVYCSVGYRSAGVAAELQALGYSNVKNLKHSIFAWASQGLPMVDKQGNTHLVHPYNRIWGRLVPSSLHSYEP